MPEHKLWLSFAESDLRFAKIGLNSGDDMIIGAILYHCQQCVEKAFKAYLLYKGQPLLRVHDLVTLLKLCAAIDIEFIQFLSDVTELNPYSTKARYPDSAFLMPSISVAQWGIEQATNIFEFVASKFPTS